MIQPQEIEVWHVLPALRKEIVASLLKLGKTQKEIALLLSITPAAVSQYKNKKRAKSVKFNQKILEEIDVSAKNIMDNKSCLTRELQKLCGLVKKEGILCELHKKHSNICCNCKICLK